MWTYHTVPMALTYILLIAQTLGYSGGKVWRYQVDGSYGAWNASSGKKRIRTRETGGVDEDIPFDEYFLAQPASWDALLVEIEANAVFSKAKNVASVLCRSVFREVFGRCTLVFG